MSQNIYLQIINVDEEDVKISTQIKTKNIGLQSTKEQLNKLQFIAQKEGYISFSIDTIIEKKDTITANIFWGKKYKWKKLTIDENLLKDITDVGIINTFKQNNLTNNLLLPQKLLTYWENNGHPFASIFYDSVYINNNEISAVLKTKKGIKYFIDSIRIFGNVQLKNSFLQKYLTINNDDIYNKEKLLEIDKKTNELSFIKTYKQFDVLLLAQSAIVNVYLNPVKTNKFDAIVGFLPSNEQANGKLLFTVDAKINLENAFATGEKININWQQIQPNSPRIELKFSKPYVFNTNFGLLSEFNLFKKDSAFLNVNFKLGLNYANAKNASTQVFFSNASTRIIEPDTLYTLQSKKLPSVLDASFNNIGFKYLYNGVDNKRNPTAGFTIDIETIGGIKNIKKNDAFTNIKANGFNYKTIYDSIKLNDYQAKLILKCNYYKSLGKQSVLKTSLSVGALFTNTYLTNEQFQIGGFKLLRGFDEDNIFTNQYLVTSCEYRYLFGESSHFFGFTDVGFTKNSVMLRNNNYIGWGVGMALLTKQGILQVSLAMGKKNDQAFNFRETKIHVGILNNF